MYFVAESNELLSSLYIPSITKYAFICQLCADIPYFAHRSSPKPNIPSLFFAISDVGTTAIKF